MPTFTASGHEQAEARFPIAVVSAPSAADSLSFSDFSSAVMNEPRAALPPAEVSWASSAVSLARYAFSTGAALDVGSLASGVRVETTPELILLMITQSAADGELAELAPVELAVPDADVAGAGADVDAAVGVELDDELDELQPATRAPLAASTATAVSEERLDISGTSMGVEWKGRQSHAQTEPRSAIAVITVVDAWALGSVSAFLNAVMNEARAALPTGDFSVAASVVSRDTYPFKAASALAVDSVCSGSSTATTPELMLLMVAQSAVDGLLAEPVEFELATGDADATADADVAGAETVAVADVVDATGAELEDELDEVQPAMRAPLRASTARAGSEERLGISGTSMGVERGVASHEISPTPRRKGHHMPPGGNDTWLTSKPKIKT